MNACRQIKWMCLVLQFRAIFCIHIAGRRGVLSETAELSLLRRMVSETAVVMVVNAYMEGLDLEDQDKVNALGRKLAKIFM